MMYEIEFCRSSKQSHNKEYNKFMFKNITQKEKFYFECQILSLRKILNDLNSFSKGNKSRVINTETQAFIISIYATLIRL